MEPEGSLPCSREPASNSGPCITFRNELGFLQWGVVSSSPSHQTGGPPVVGCLRPHIQNIRSCPPYLEAVSSIRNLRTRHVMVTGTHLAWFFSFVSNEIFIRYFDELHNKHVIKWRIPGNGVINLRVS
jgi:hypothetical protein